MSTQTIVCCLNDPASLTVARKASSSLTPTATANCCILTMETLRRRSSSAVVRQGVPTTDNPLVPAATPDAGSSMESLCSGTPECKIDEPLSSKILSIVSPVDDTEQALHDIEMALRANRSRELMESWMVMQSRRQSSHSLSSCGDDNHPPPSDPGSPTPEFLCISFNDDDLTRVIVHIVSPIDTLQGLALFYGISMCDIRRANRLWSSDSVHCRKSLLIPVPQMTYNGLENALSMIRKRAATVTTADQSALNYFSNRTPTSLSVSFFYQDLPPLTLN